MCEGPAATTDYEKQTMHAEAYSDGVSCMDLPGVTPSELNNEVNGRTR